MSSCVCFVCAKTFKPSDTSVTRNGKGHCRNRATRSRGKEEEDDLKIRNAFHEKEEKEEALFHRILTRYLNLSPDFVPPSSVQEKFALFCSRCASLINSIYGDYQELREVELRLSSKLGGIGEMMMQKPKLGESLLKKLAEQLMISKKKGGGGGGNGTSYVQKVRNVIAQELALKGRKAELELEWGSGNDKMENSYQSQEDIGEDEGGVTSRTKGRRKEEDEDERNEVVIKTEVLDNGFDDFDESFLNSPDANSPVNLPKQIDEKADAEEKEQDSDSSYDGDGDIPSEADDDDSDNENSDENWSSDADKKQVQATKRKKTTTTPPAQIKPKPKRQRRLEYESIKSRADTTASFSNRTSKKLGVEDSDGPFHCDQCGKDYDKWQHFWKHLTRIHEEVAKEKTVNCPFCWMSFAFPQSFSYHLKARHEETISKKVFVCDADYAEEDIVDPSTPRLGCDESFEKIEELNSHLESHTSPDKIYHCPKCNCGFLNPHMRELHELQHIRGYRGNHKCPKCGIFSAGFAKFKDHYNLRHGAKLLIHKCHLCLENCLSRISLQNHLKAHETGKLPKRSSTTLSMAGPQVCELCGQQYKGATADEMLRRHMKRIHSGSEITCSICSKVFHYAIQYDKHMKTEHQISKLPCSICKKELGSTRRLKEHMKIVHAAEPEQHLCPHCGATFKTMRYLQRHIVWMHKELVEVQGKHVCERCGERFHRIELFTRHKKMNSCQKMEVDEEEMSGGETVCWAPTTATEME